MKNIFRIFKRDMKNIFTNSMAIILAVGVALLPSLYAWFNIYANWDPYGKTGAMKVAVCNEDEGATYKKLEIAIGDQICENLKGNDSIDWQFVSKKDAVKGVEAGRYYAAIEIPSGFSKNLASIVTEDYERPQIVYYANEKKNAIATKITDKVVQTVQTTVNESFVTTVVDVLSAVIGSAMESDSVTGENTFDYLKHQVNNARETIDTLSDSLVSMEKLLKLTKNVNYDDTSIKDLLNDTDTMIEDTTDAVKVTQEAFSTTVDSLGKVLSSSCEVIDTSADTLDKIADKDMSNVTATFKQISVQLDNISDQLTEMSSFLTKLNTALPKPITEITNFTTKLDNISTSLKETSTLLVKVSSIDYDKTAYDVAKKLRSVSSSLKSAEKSYSNKVEPVLTKTVDSLVITLGDLSDMLNNFDSKSPQINTFVSTLKECADTGENLVSSMNKVLKNTDKKLVNLINIIDNIKDSEIVNAAVNLTTKNGGDLGEFLACPVEVKTDKVYGIENYGSAMAPFYSTLAIWVGAIMLVALVKTNVKKKKEISPLLKPHEEFFGRSLLFMCIAIVQGLIICLGDLYFLKIQCYHPLKFLFAGVLASVVYSFFIYSIVYTFGDIGKAIGVIMLVVQIGGSGGTFPIDVTPRFFVSINPYIPFTFVIEAMRECICGTYSNNYWIYLLKLLAYAVVGLIIGLPVKAIVKKPVKFFEKKVEETGLF